MCPVTDPQCCNYSVRILWNEWKRWKISPCSCYHSAKETCKIKGLAACAILNTVIQIEYRNICVFVMIKVGVFGFFFNLSLKDLEIVILLLDSIGYVSMKSRVQLVLFRLPHGFIPHRDACLIVLTCLDRVYFIIFLCFFFLVLLPCVRRSGVCTCACSCGQKPAHMCSVECGGYSCD